MVVRACGLCWGFVGAGVILLVLAEVVGNSISRAWWPGHVTFTVPAFACLLMALALGIIMPLDTATNDHAGRPWDPRRRARVLFITIGGWTLNLLFAVCAFTAGSALR